MIDDFAGRIPATVSRVFPPLNTSPALRAAALANFEGQPNRTIDKPCLKSSYACQLKHKDVYTVRHFSDTTFAATNSVCDLAGGTNYTWLVTADGQMSFGPYVDTLEWGNKHFNLAFARTAWVGGEVHVPESPGAPIVWNLNSGTYSWYVADAMRPDDPDAYFAEVLYPRILPVWATEPCVDRMVFTEEVIFVDVLPAYAHLEELCEDNLWVSQGSALTWKKDPEEGINICPYVQASESVCEDRA